MTLPHPNDGFPVFPQRLPERLLQQRSLSAGASDENESARKDGAASSSRVLQMGSFLASKLLEKAVIEATREENDKVTLDDLVGLMESFVSGASQRRPDIPTDLESFSDQDQSVTTSAKETIVSTVETNDVDEKEELASAGTAVMLQNNAKESIEEEVSLDKIRLSTTSNITLAAGGQEAKTSDVEISSSAESTGPGSDESTREAVEEEMSLRPVTNKSDAAEIERAIDSPDLDGDLPIISEKSNVESQADNFTATSTTPESPDETDGGKGNVTNLFHNKVGQLGYAEVSDGDGADAASVCEAPANLAGDNNKLVDGKPPKIIETSSISDEVRTLTTPSSNEGFNDDDDDDDVGNLEARIPDIISREFGRPLEVIASNIPPLRQTYVRGPSTPPSKSDGSTAPTPEPSTSSPQPPTTSLRSTADSVVEKLHEDVRKKAGGDSHDEMLMNMVDAIAAQKDEFRVMSDTTPIVVTADRQLKSPQHESEVTEVGPLIHVKSESPEASEPWFAETTLEVSSPPRLPNTEVIGTSAKSAVNDEVYFNEADDRLSLLADLKEKFFPCADEQRQHTQGASKFEASLAEVPAQDAFFETGARNFGTKFRRNVRKLFRRRRDIPAVVRRSDARQPVIGSRAESVSDARQQPKSADTESHLAERYGKMDLEERAFTILYDLGMIEIHPAGKEEIENSREREFGMPKSLEMS